MKHDGFTENEHETVVETADDFSEPTPEQLATALRFRAGSMATLRDVRVFRRLALKVERLTPDELKALIHAYW